MTASTLPFQQLDVSYELAHYAVKFMTCFISLLGKVAANRHKIIRHLQLHYVELCFKISQLLL
jgi:hypothetical protein